MIEKQLKARGIDDKKVLQAFKNVPRHEFVPEEYHRMAYSDGPLPIGSGQTISQPYIVALMTQVLEPGPEDKVLEVGTGSGYQAAILAELYDTVYSIEIIKPLAERAITTLKELNYDNVKVQIGDGYQGWQQHAPFDAIIVTCAPTKVPEPLKQQLAEGGRMVIPVGKKYTQELYLFIKEKGELVREDLVPVRFVPMIDEEGETY